MAKKENKWEENNIFFSDTFSFRNTDKELMEVVFKIWFDETIKKYGRSKWIECKMQTRLGK
jgi:hypothetical protein